MHNCGQKSVIGNPELIYLLRIYICPTLDTMQVDFSKHIKKEVMSHDLCMFMDMLSKNSIALMDMDYLIGIIINVSNGLSIVFKPISISALNCYLMCKFHKYENMKYGRCEMGACAKQLLGILCT